MVGFGAEFAFLQELQAVQLTPEEVSARLKPLHRMHNQVKIVNLCGTLEEVNRNTLCGAVEHGGELCQCNRCRPIERSGRPAAQDHLLDRVLWLFFFGHWLESDGLVCRSG